MIGIARRCIKDSALSQKNNSSVETVEAVPTEESFFICREIYRIHPAKHWLARYRPSALRMGAVFAAGPEDRRS